MTSPIRYSDHLEQPSEAEAATIQSIIDTMAAEMDKVAAREHHTTRASHAKSTGLLKGHLTIPALPAELAQGLFATPATYEALVRFAQGPGEHLADSVSTHRGMAVKLLGVEGPRLPTPGGNEAPIQDFVFATGAAFAQSRAESFLVAMKGIEKATNLPEAAKSAVATAARAANTLVNALGIDSPTLGFFGHPRRNPLADTYFSQAPLRFGDHVAKLAFFPVSPHLVALIDHTVDTGTDPDAFRTALVAHMRTYTAEFELRAQLCTDHARMPIEDASVPWSEEASP